MFQFGFCHFSRSLMSGRFIFKRELSRTKGKKTSKQLADLEEKRSSLIRQILIWRPIQLAYIPHVASLLPLLQDDTTNCGGYYSNPESTPLYLPSSLPRKFANAQNSRIYLRQSTVYERRRLTTLWLMSAAYVVSFKDYGSSKSSTFQEQEIGRTRGCSTRIADLITSSNFLLTVTVSRTPL